MKNPDIEHFIRNEQYVQKVYNLYMSALRDILRLLSYTKIDTTKPFNFNDYPDIKYRVANLIKGLSSQVKFQIEKAITEEWLQANIKNDAIVDKVLINSKLSDAQKKVFYARNKSALKSFLDRKDGGLSL